jgi:hypothetical protein
MSVLAAASDETDRCARSLRLDGFPVGFI